MIGKSVDAADFISIERLKTYERHTDRLDKAVALHNHTLQLGSSLMSMIALFELSLRNSTNERLAEDFGDDEWLVSPDSPLPLKDFEKNAIRAAKRNAQKAAYAKLGYRQKIHLDAFAFPGWRPSAMSHEQITGKRRSLFVVSHGQIVAQTTFNFWKRLYSSDYEKTLWKPSLKKVFPNKKLRRSDISKALEVVYATRNRVAHHEPVYGRRLQEVIDAFEFLRNSLGARNGETDTSFQDFSRIQYLRLRMDHESYLQAWKTLT